MNLSPSIFTRLIKTILAANILGYPLGVWLIPGSQPYFSSILALLNLLLIGLALLYKLRPAPQKSATLPLAWVAMALAGVAIASAALISPPARPSGLPPADLFYLTFDLFFLHGIVLFPIQPGPQPRWIHLLFNASPYLLCAIFLLLLLFSGAASPTLIGLLQLGVGLLIFVVIAHQITADRENQRLKQSLDFTLQQFSANSKQLAETGKSLRDEVQAHKITRDRLSYEALHDPLTDLPNRLLLLDRLNWALQYTRRHEGSTFAVFCVTLDHLKSVTDSLGYSIGDQLLVQAALRLKDCLRASDTVARTDSDEFVLLLSEPGTLSQLTLVAERIQESLRQPFELGERKGYISASIGIVTNIRDNTAVEDILRDAEIAMHQAKNLGKARHEFFHVGMRTRAISRLEIEHDLHTALERSELEVYYQPIILLENERLVGFEALLRWKSPTRGMIPPTEFIPVAEECGLILSIGSWVLREACRQSSEWKRSFLTPPNYFISVNISAQQFIHPAFIHEVEDTLASSHLDPRSLKLEITESVFLKNSDSAVRTFQRLTELGVECEIDDFGTGFSALSYLQNFPIHTIKIDRSFIQHIQPAERTGLVHAIMAMSKDLKIQTIAEGLETEMQLSELRAMGCQLGQGFFFHKAMDSHKAEELLAGALLQPKTAVHSEQGPAQS